MEDVDPGEVIARYSGKIIDNGTLGELEDTTYVVKICSGKYVCLDASGPGGKYINDGKVSSLQSDCECPSGGSIQEGQYLYSVWKNVDKGYCDQENIQVPVPRGLYRLRK